MEEYPIPSFTEKTYSKAEYCGYGNDNKLPEFLYKLYNNSSVLQSIINGTADYIYGESFTVDKMSDSDIKKAIIDYLIFGGFAIQLYYYNGSIYKAETLDFIKCRKSEDETKIYYAKKWGSYSTKAITFDAWNKDITKGTCVYYYKGNKTRGIYPIPIWNGALKSVIISTEISNFHLHNLLNGFNSNFVINFNNGAPDPETQDVIEKQIKDTFCGSDNAGKFMITWNDDTEHQTTIERIQSDDFDNKYQSLATFVQKDIFTAFRAQPVLFGTPLENIGFNTQEFSAAYTLYNKTVVTPIQNEFKSVFSSLGLGVENQPFNIKFE